MSHCMFIIIKIGVSINRGRAVEYWVQCDAIHIKYNTAQDVDVLHHLKLMVNMKICLPCLQNLFSPFSHS